MSAAYVPADFDPESTYELWTPIPRPESLPDVMQWAHETAHDMIRERGLDPVVTSPLTSYLAALAEQPPAEHSHVRFMFMFAPEVGATLWELTYAEPDPDLADVVIVGADLEAQLGSEVAEFEHHGHTGLSCVRYLLADEGPDDPAGEQTIEAVALMTVTRTLGGRTLCLIARAQSALLESLSMSLLPMQHLLTSELLAELVEGPSTEPLGSQT